ncbi:MAG: type II toxin-antitoxin system HicB family antitoxin [Coriobacteriales bacterium]|jgi:predicted RNase H-like HicB family nuclease|nr:type II toxin-antitoxin system HicB family antitoxin [Coriobacteriales bacterium]
MRYVYPVVFTIEGDAILASVPDLPGTHTFGETWSDALYMAQDAMEMWLWDAENKGEDVPEASDPSSILAQRAGDNVQVSMVAADTDEYRRRADARAVKKTLSIPAWLNFQAERANAPFSQILQQGLKEYLHIV